jgi:hypothetical protein
MAHVTDQTEQTLDEAEEHGAAVVPVARPVGAEAVTARADDVLVLPLRATEDGIGIYSESSVILVKRLRAAGMEAHYLHPPEHRLFEGRNNYFADAVVVIVLGVISSATWEGIRLLLLAKKTRRMKVTFGRREDADGGSITWWQSEGPAESVVESIDHLLATDSSLNRGDPRQIRAEDESREDREDPEPDGEDFGGSE